MKLGLNKQRIATLLAALSLLVLLSIIVIKYSWVRRTVDRGVEFMEEEIFLPPPKLEGKMSLEEAIARRRSVRKYLDVPLTIEQVAQIVWAAQGITDTRYRFRAAPSAGATYPLELYVVVGEKGVRLPEGGFIEAGIYRYNVYRHSLILVKKGDIRGELSEASLGQPWVEEAPVVIVITAIYERTTARYGSRGVRYVHMEVGHVGQNIYLQTVALGLGTVAVGAFDDNSVREVINAPPEEKPLYIMPIGVVEELHEISLDELMGFYETYRRKD